MIIELKISEHMGYYKKSLVPIIDLINKFGLPFNYSKYITKKNIKNLINKMKFDKKANYENVSLICVDHKGGFVKSISFKKLESILLKLINDIIDIIKIVSNLILLLLSVLIWI